MPFWVLNQPKLPEPPSAPKSSFRISAKAMLLRNQKGTLLWLVGAFLFLEKVGYVKLGVEERNGSPLHVEGLWS